MTNHSSFSSATRAFDVIGLGKIGVEAAELAAFAAAKCGHPRSAALLLGHARALHARRGSYVSALAVGDSERATALVLRSLDRETCEHLLERGRELDESQADALLLAAEDVAER